MRSTRGLFVYPWDLLAEGVEESVERIGAELGCTALALNCNYHSGRFFHPRHRNGSSVPTLRGVVNHREGSGAAFTPDPTRYRDALLPLRETPLADAQVVERVTATARRTGLGLTLWVVVLHSSSLGAAHPELCVCNLYGDRFRFALCPAQPRVRNYACGLVDDIANQFHPDWLMLESPTYLGLVHGDHHELILANLDELAKLLLGLCFCDACQARATAVGVSATDALVAARRLCDRLIEDERGGLDPAFTASETVSALLAFPELYAYLRVRGDTVTSLLSDLRSRAAVHGVRTGVTSSIFTRPASKAWMEGTELRAASAAVDSILTVSYFPDPAAVRADIRWVKGLIEGRPLQVALNAGHPDALSELNLVTKALAAAEEGATGIFYYNYGLLTHERLRWVAAANTALASRELL